MNPYCVWCGVLTRTGVRCGETRTIEHLIPWSQGGVDVRPNVTTACRTCNLSRGASCVPTWMTPESIALMDRDWTGDCAEAMYAALQHHRSLGREIDPEWSIAYLGWARLLMGNAVYKLPFQPPGFYGLIVAAILHDEIDPHKEKLARAFPYTTEFDRLEVEDWLKRKALAT